MSSNGQTEARKIHDRLNHPIIDADGHWAEFAPHMREEFRRIGGDTAVEALAMASARIPNSLNMSVAERRRRRIGQEAFWFLPTRNTLDRATAMMPRLLYERLDDLGLDFCVVYPTAGLGYYRLPPDKLRRALCRAYNVFTAEQFRPYNDRIIPAAIIPMYTPEEAIEELEFVSRQLGTKVVMMGSLIRRPIPALVEEHPEAAKFVEWYDPIAIDSAHDYEPVWQKLRELRIAPLLSGVRGEPGRDLRAVARMAVKLGEAMLAWSGTVAAVDINPVIVFETGAGAVAVDALVIISDP